MAELLLLLLFSSTATTVMTTELHGKVYYVRPDYKNSCPPHQICHRLSHYISRPSIYFTSDTTIIFLEGQHRFDLNGLVQVNTVHDLTLKGQGEWPVAGPKETVMQSTAIIKCTKAKGGFHFDHSKRITVKGLTVVNCGNQSVFLFRRVVHLTFHQNSIQNMSGYGLLVISCNQVMITLCSFYHSVHCASPMQYHHLSIGGGIGIVYNQDSNTDYTLELSHSNMTECCNSKSGGGIYLNIKKQIGSAKLLFSHLVLLHNTARYGAGMALALSHSNENISVKIRDCDFSQGHAAYGGGIHSHVGSSAIISIQNTRFKENSGYYVSEIRIICYYSPADMRVSFLNSSIQHTTSHSRVGVLITGFYTKIEVVNTKMTFANHHSMGFSLDCSPPLSCILHMNDSQIVNSRNVPLLFHISHRGMTVFRNCRFSHNTGGQSVISIYQLDYYFNNTFINCTISDNTMNGITLFETGARFKGHNVIQNNRYSEGAGITLFQPAFILVDGKLILRNNTADKHGGGILVKQPALSSVLYTTLPCSLHFIGNSSLIVFSGNRAKQGGGDMYNALLVGCDEISSRATFDYNSPKVPHIGRRNETSWYITIPDLFIKHIHFRNADRLSSTSSDPVMVCFCNESNVPDCSDRNNRHVQMYPGVEFNTTIATVGYYGGTSPGNLQVSVKDAKLVRYYGQNEITKCFKLHIFLQNSFSTTALVDIRVKDAVRGLGVSIMADILACPIGFSDIIGQCHCEQFLANRNVQCNVSMASSCRFLRSGNSWFGYINQTQCVTGTTSCPFDYCNQSNVSFDIMAPDRQCLGNRTGILCGQCQSHLSIMLGSNQCGTCSNWYLFLLPVFALAGIVLVAVLMFLNLSVSVGTINGLLFYANMVKLNEAFFFPNGSVPVVSQFISWLNLDLGIEVCLFNGLDGYWNTWLQFVFPSYLFLLMGGIIVGCRYSVWLCRLCGSHAVPALATLFLMSYTKILLTVTNALSMSRLPCNDSILTVWSVDGNIDYVSSKHLILVVFSCGVLVIGLAYPVLVLCAPLIERYSHKCIPQHCRWNPVAQFKPLIDAYGGPYKDKYRFWTGVTLIVRLIVTIASSFTSGGLAIINAFIITTCVVAIFTFWFFANGVYKNIYLSSIEAFYLLNLFFLSSTSLGFAFFSLQNKQMSITTVSVCLAFIVSLVTIVMHLKDNFDLKYIKRRLGFGNRTEYIAVSQVAADQDDEVPLGSPPAIVYGSRRGAHQFILEFPRSSDGQEPSSPVLLEREPLLMHTDIQS